MKIMTKRKFSVRLLIFAALIGVWMVVLRGASAQETKPTEEKPVLSAVEGRPLVLDRAPVRVIQDPYATFEGIAVDLVHNEVVITDSNRHALLTYDRLTKAEGIAEPLRTIIGSKTHLGHTCGVAIDPENEEIFAVDADWKQNMCVFPRQAKGNEGPLRELNVDITTYGIFLDRKNDELVITVEGTNKISVYRRLAQGDEEPLRIIQGPKTDLAGPHGVFVDAENDEIFVANHGNWYKVKTGTSQKVLGYGKQQEPLETLDAPSTGKFFPPSITVYSRKANGDVTPLRTIQGSKTQLNWPGGIYVDPISDQIAVANTGGNSILFFSRTASGDVAPVRIIKGEATDLDNPMGIVIDTENNELWAVNRDNYVATVYPRTAKGDVAPLRTIRSAPKGAITPGFSGPSGVVYDPKRKEILISNWKGNPRISVLASSARGDVVRVVEGQATLLARSVHQFAIDTVHDEIVLPNAMAEAILFFRVEAKGEEAPIRVIQGPKTKIGYTDNVAVDPIHNEVFTAQSRKDAILVFKRDVGGDVAPIRIIHGPKTKLSSPWSVAVDPKNDLLVTINQNPKDKGILIFKRTDEGDVAPQAFISGPKTGMKPGMIRETTPRTVDVYPEGKKIIVPVTGSYERGGGYPGFVGIWKYTDNGDVAPWAIINNPPDLPLIRGGALNPEAKEIMFVEIEKGALVVYHIPELFEWGAISAFHKRGEILEHAQMIKLQSG